MASKSMWLYIMILLETYRVVYHKKEFCMKNFIRFLGIIALVVVIGFSMVTCSDGSGNDNSSDTKEESTNQNQNPNLTVPTSPAGIPNFFESKGYTAITKEGAEEIITELESLLDEFVEELNDYLGSGEFSSFFSKSNSFSRAVNARAVETYDFDGTLNQFWNKFLREEFGNLPEEVKLDGYIKGTVGFNDSEENPFPLTANGDSKFRIEFLEGFKLDLGWYDYEYNPESREWEESWVEDLIEAMGVVTGTVNLNNVHITSENSMSGSVSATVDYAVNIAYEKQWVKCLGKVTVTANLNNQTASATATLSAYGNSATPLITKTITATATTKKITASIK